MDAKAVGQAEAWRRYNEWLTAQLSQKLFDGEVDLEQVYIPLRAYYEEADRLKDSFIVVRHVDFIHHAMQNWLGDQNSRDTLRLICGGPGYGKSSFAKKLCDEINVFNHRNLRALYVPLHQLNLTEHSDAVGAINAYLKEWGFDFCDPFERNGSARLLLVPDGLDELAMQGEAAQQAAIKFVEQILRAIQPLNAVTPRIRCIVCGRDIMIQSVTNALQLEEHVWHLLPYFLPNEETQISDSLDHSGIGENKKSLVVSYRDPKGILYRDQRPEWWKKYAQATGKNYDDVPIVLRGAKLDPITSLPLLNYLLALSYERAKIKFDSQSTRNEIYFDLIERIYERDWATKNPKNIHTKGLGLDAFVRILETIAMVAWRSGDTRTARVEDIEASCQELGLLELWHEFKPRAAEGLTRIFTAFYIRYREFGAGVVEFSHKSFGDYLAARAIVNEWDRLSGSKQRPKLEFLGYWLKFCGDTKIDAYILDFIRDEVALRERRAAAWQEMAVALLQHHIDYDMPVDSLLSHLNPTQANQFNRNATEALLAIHSSCARVTLTVSQLYWEQRMRMYVWLIRIQGENPDGRIVNALLNHLTFGFDSHPLYARGLYLRQAELKGSRFENVDLSGAALSGADLSYSHWKSAILCGADMESANLDSSVFVGANLDGAMLRQASFVGAQFEQAQLRFANMTAANFRRSQMKKAVFTSSLFESADFSEAIIDEANFRGAKLLSVQMPNISGVEVRMESSILTGSTMTDSKLENANFSYADLNDVDFTRANLHGARLLGATMSGTKLEKTRLENTNLQGVDLSTIKIGDKGPYWNGAIIDEHTRLPQCFPDTLYEMSPHPLIPGATILRRRR